MSPQRGSISQFKLYFDWQSQDASSGRALGYLRKRWRWQSDEFGGYARFRFWMFDMGAVWERFMLVQGGEDE